MKKVILLTLIVLYAFGNEVVLANYPANLKSGEKQEETQVDKSSKLTTSSLWEKATPSKTDQFEDVESDDDTKLYAPPPGETGNPQKMPLNGMDAAILLLLSGSYLLYRWRMKKYQDN